MTIRNPDCICDGRTPWCAPCVVSLAFQMRVLHWDTLTTAMLKRRLGRSINGREAAILVEASKRIATPKNSRDGRYVD